MTADYVHALNCKTEGEIAGQETGDVKLHLDALAAANVEIMVFGMSAKARGYDGSLLGGFNASFAIPDKLITSSLNADTVLAFTQSSSHFYTFKATSLTPAHQA
jgi:hypothetical protein